MRRMLSVALTATIWLGLLPGATAADGLQPQTVSITSTAPVGALIHDTYQVTAEATSGLTPVVTTVDSSICTVDGSGLVTFNAEGTCTINADQPGDGVTWDAAPTASQPVAVGRIPQAIDFAILADKTFGDAPFSVTATGGGSGNPVTFSSTTTDVCTVEAATVTIVAAGGCTIRASQAGDLTYADATPIDRSFTVGKASQTISYTSTAPTDAVIGGATYAPTASATSGLAVEFTIDPGSAAVCSLSAGDVSFIARGTCTIVASQAGDTNWNAATPVTQDVLVGNEAPVCTGATVTVVMNVASTGSLACTDADGDPLTYKLTSAPSTGGAVIDAAGTWTYTPAVDTIGTTQFILAASDGMADSAGAAIDVTIVNSPADAFNDGPPRTNVLATATSTIGVLANDSAGAGDTGQPIRITAVTQPAKGVTSTNGATVTYDPKGCATGIDSTPFSYTITDGLTSDTASALVNIVRPGDLTSDGVTRFAVTPLTDAPGVAIVGGATMGSTVPVRVSWCGVTASGTGVRSYRVGQSTNNGSTYPTLISSATTATSSIRNVSTSTYYRWRVRTVDSAGRTGGYAISPSGYVARYQENASAIRYSSGWTRTYASGASGSYQRYASSSAASATFVAGASVRQVGIVSSRGSTLGSLRMYVDGRWVATVSERSSTTQYRKIIHVVTLTPGRTHTIVLKPAGNGRVYLDALLALR